MATYLPNSNDYIAKTKAYTPDFKFLADTLGRRQDRYNTNYKHLNDLYGKVVHADLSHKDNIHKRDEYANLLVPKIQQLTGTDFSLQQNADAARALFKPFFEDKTVVRDIVYTKRFNNESQRAEGYRKSADAKERDKYWQDGVDRLNYYMEDFKNASLQETMSMQLPEYVEDPDLIEKGIEYLMNYEGKGKKLEISDVVFSDDGVWMTTMTNGSVLTNRPTGVVNEETGEMGTYNPAANIIAKTILDDPLIARGYATSAYVKARKFYENEDNIAKYGSKENAERYFLNQMINQSKTGIEKETENETEQKTKLIQTKNSWEKYLEKYPKANTKARQTYLETLGAITAIDKGIQKNNQTIKDISREYKDLDEMRNIAYQAYMNYSINKDILSAANEYAMTTMQVKDRKVNPLVSKKLDHQYRMIELQQKHDNEKALADYKASLENKGGLNLEGPGMQSEAPDAEFNLSQYENTNDLMADNKFYIDEKMKNSVNLPMFNAVESMYTQLANIWSSADYEVDPTGIEVEVFVYADGTGYMKDTNPTNKDGVWKKKFLTWNEAKEYLINGAGRNQTDLQDLYNEVLQKYHHQVSLGDEGAFAPMLGTEQFNELNTTISQIESQIANGKADILNVVEKQNKAYKSVYDMVMAQADPSLKEFFDKYGSPLVENADGTFRMLNLAEYQQVGADKFRENADNANLPAVLKGVEDFNNFNEFQQYLLGIFTPEVLEKLGVNNYAEAISENYLIDQTALRNAKPGRMSDDVWQKSIDATMDNMTRDYLRTGSLTDSRGRKFPMRLQDNVARYSNEDWRPFSGGSYNSINDKTATAYNNLYDAMNSSMTSSRAGSGSPTFSARNEFMLKDQVNDGSIAMTDNWTGTYIHGNAHPEIATQLTLALNAVNKLDKSQVIVRLGDPSMHVEKGLLQETEWSEGMDQILKQIRTDLRQPASATNMPNVSITYNENLGGKSGWTLQFDQDYMKKLRSSASIDNNLLDKLFEEDKNTITIYVDKGLINNPLDIINMDVSSTRRIIRENGMYSHVVPQGGSVKAWTGGDGHTIYTQMTQGTWIQNDDKEWEYREIAGKVVALPPGEAKIDEMMRTQREHLENLANKNRITQGKNLK
tara:strand:+ start:1083 stop:4427 length:3345 start_codon:yes stop_codon:yes gene_type:complete